MMMTIPGLWIPALPAGMTVSRLIVCNDVVSTRHPALSPARGKGLCLPPDRFFLRQVKSARRAMSDTDAHQLRSGIFTEHRRN